MTTTETKAPLNIEAFIAAVKRKAAEYATSGDSIENSVARSAYIIGAMDALQVLQQANPTAYGQIIRSPVAVEDPAS